MKLRFDDVDADVEIENGPGAMVHVKVHTDTLGAGWKMTAEHAKRVAAALLAAAEAADGLASATPTTGGRP